MLWENFSGFITGQITIEPWQSEDSNGKQFYAAPVSVACVEQGPTSKAVYMIGQLIVPRNIVFIGPEQPVTPKDRITLNGAVYGLGKMRVDPMHWGESLDYQVLMFA
jgi:hypothetical protein